MRYLTNIFPIFVLACLPVIARGDVIYGTAGSTYTQNFDSLANTNPPPTHTWTDDTTIPGWFSNEPDYQANDGGGNTGHLYSFGTDGSGERALGSISSGSTEDPIRYGARFTNATGSTLDSFTLSYTGEQWRNAGQQVNHTITFGFATGTGLDIDSAVTGVSQLNFTSPTVSNSATMLDGNLPANQAALSFTVTGINWQNGEQLLIRWDEPNDSGADHGLAIDDLSFTAVVPEPSSMAILGVIGMVVTLRRRRS